MDRIPNSTSFVPDYTLSSEPQYSSFQSSGPPSSAVIMDLNHAGTGWSTPSMTKSHKDSDPRPGWFVSRGNGLFVPLIALDELPDTIQLRDVPRFMLAQQTVGMEFLGEFPASGYKFEMVSNELDDHLDHNRQTFPEPSDVNSVRQVDPPGDPLITGIASLITGECTTYRQRAATRPSTPRVKAGRSCSPGIQRHDGEVQSRIDNIVRSSTPADPSMANPLLPPSGREPDLGKKIYCTYWISSGQCNYTQQGCLYKHEMPDRATLANIGFRNTPRWWQERRAQGLEPMQKAGPGPAHSSANNQHHGRSSSNDSGRENSTRTDSTGSLHLGNPDSQRFSRKNLAAASQAMGRSVRGHSHMKSKPETPLSRGNDAKSHKHTQMQKPRGKLTQARKPPCTTDIMLTALRRNSTTSSREIHLLNTTAPPLQPSRSSSLKQASSGPRNSKSPASSPLFLSHSPSDSVDSEIAITAPPCSPNEPTEKPVKQGIYDRASGKVVSPSVIHRPLFTSTTTKPNTDNHKREIESLNRETADAAISQASHMRVTPKSVEARERSDSDLQRERQVRQVAREMRLEPTNEGAAQRLSASCARAYRTHAARHEGNETIKPSSEGGPKSKGSSSDESKKTGNKKKHGHAKPAGKRRRGGGAQKAVV